MKKISLILIILFVPLSFVQSKLALSFSIDSNQRFQNYCVNGVEKQFEELQVEGTKICLEASCGFESNQYTKEIFNELGFNNHLQGIARKGNYIFVSGGNGKIPKADLFIAKVGSQDKTIDETISLCENVTVKSGGDNEIYTFENNVDKVLTSIDITSGPKNQNWHGGGLSQSGDLLVVPVEEWRKNYGYSSSILFMDIKNPAKPRLMKSLTIERESSDAGASFVHRLSDGKWVVGVVTKDKRINDNQGLELYFSKSNSLMDGFQKSPILLDNETNLKSHYGQGMGLVEDCDSKNLYLITFDNKNVIPYFPEDTNKAYLYKFSLQNDAKKSASLELISEKNFGKSGTKSFGHFRAATGVEVGKDNNLRILSSNFFRYSIQTDYSEEDSMRVLKLQEYTQKK